MLRNNPFSYCDDPSVMRFASSLGFPDHRKTRAEGSPRKSSRNKLAASVKTVYLYGMNSRLVNVRLDDRLFARARRLRAEGITLSDLVREAIDRQYEQLM